MYTLDEFKKMLGVDKINFMKSTKTQRQFATVGQAKIIIAKNADLAKPLFASMNDKLGIYVVFNSTAEAGVSL